MLYFDNAATSWPKPEVVYQTQDRIFRQGGNPGRGVNQVSLQAGRILFQSREIIARLFGIHNSERIVFTQNITEAINVGLQGLLKAGDHVLISSLEHNAVVRPLEYLKSRGISYDIVPCSPEGLLDPASVEPWFKENTKLLCCTHASNVLGSILPISELGSLAKKHHCLFMVDSAQTAGILPIDVEQQQIDFLAFTGHKSLLGPPGAGGFYLKPGIQIKALIHGGTGMQSLTLSQLEIWPEGMESGTRNVPAIAALAAGIEFILGEGLDKIRSHETALMAALLTELKNIPGVKILGPLDPDLRVGLVSCFFDQCTPEDVGIELDQKYDIITRTGLHCAPLAHQTAGTINQGALRISLSYFHSEKDIALLLEALKAILGGKDI